MFHFRKAKKSPAQIVTDGRDDVQRFMEAPEAVALSLRLSVSACVAIGMGVAKAAGKMGGNAD